MVLRKWMLCACVTGMGASGAAHAQQAEPTETASSAGLAEIVVTAQKRAENLQDVPISISAVTEESLQRSGVATLDAVQQLTPGMSMSAIGSGFVSYTYIRGAGTNQIDSGSDPSVAFFVDEVYQGGAAGLQFDLLDVERVEVLKGPQGTLFGRNAAAGAISITTKRPSDSFGVTLDADVGNYDFYAARGSITGPLNSDGSLRYRFSAGARHRNPFTVNPNGRDPGRVRTIAGRAQLQYDDGGFMALVTADYFKSNNGMTNQFLATADVTGFITPAAGAAQPADQGFYRRYYDVDGFEKQKTWSLTGRMELETGVGTFTSITAYRDNRFRRLQDQDGTIAAGYAFGLDVRDRTFSQELRLAKDFDGFRAILGLYYYHQKTNRFDTIDTGNDFAVPTLRNATAIDDHEITIDSYAAFAQATLDITRRLSLTAGARFTQDTKESDRFVQVFSPLATYRVNPRRRWRSFDPAVTLDYKASDDVMLYASYRWGFKSGGFQAVVPLTRALADTPFDPEDVRAVEVGVKSKLFDNRMILNVAAFHVDIKNQQILRIPGPGLPSVVDNAGKTKTDGVDVSISVQPFENFRIDWNSTIQKARFARYLTGTTDLAGNRQLRSPDFSTSVVVEYGIPIGESRLTLRGEYYHQTRIFFDGANTSTANAFQPAYDLVNARIIFAPAGDRWQFSVWGRNLTKERYFRNVAISGASGLAVPNDPRTYGLSVNFKL